MTFKYVIVLLIIISLALPSSAIVNLTYPDEYYNLYNMNSRFSNDKTIQNEYGQSYNIYFLDSINAFSSLATYRELRRQTILMEKQNELLFEQNALLRKIAGEPSGSGLIYYDKVAINSSYDYTWENCYQNETGQDPNDLVMHFTCPS